MTNTRCFSFTSVAEIEDIQKPNKSGGNPKGGRVHELRSRPPFQGNQGRHRKPWSHSHLQSEAKGKERFQYRMCALHQQWWVFAHQSMSSRHSFKDTPTGQPVLDSLLLRFSLKVVLYRAKLTIKINHCTHIKIFSI